MKSSQMLGLVVMITLLQACLSPDDGPLESGSPPPPPVMSPIVSPTSCSLSPMALDSGGSNADENDSICTVKSSENTKLDIFKVTGGYSLTITPQSPVNTWWDSYAGIVFVADGDYCSIGIGEADLPWRVTAVRVADGSTIWSTSSSIARTTAFDYFATIPGESYYLIFSHIKTDMSAATYHDVRVNCLQNNDTNAPDSLKSKIDRRVVAPMLARQVSGTFPNADSIIAAYEKLATELVSHVEAGSSDQALATFLQNAYTTNLPLLQATHGPELRGRDPRVLFASYLAQFAVRLSHLDLSDARSIIMAKNGTCQQQAQVAGYFYELLVGSEVEITGTDWLVLGHVVTKGSDFFIDATDNVVVYMSVADWNKKTVEERILALEGSAIFGYSLGLQMTYPNPWADQLGGIDIVKQNVIDQVALLPFADLEPKGLPIIRSNAPAP